MSGTQVAESRREYPHVDDTGARGLETLLVQEDAAEERGQVSPHERITCRVHRRWIHQCVGSPLHVIPVTGHRWCRRCETAVGIVVDEVRGTVAMSCRGCGDVPTTLASRQIVRACLGSFAAWRHLRG
ncbi:MAG: hypothetical protein ACRDQ7_22155 [Haloechinothrix sp.]